MVKQGLLHLLLWQSRSGEHVAYHRQHKKRPRLDESDCSDRCCICFQTFEEDIQQEAGVDWIQCSCTCWLHEDCIVDCITDNSDEERLCPYCTRSFCWCFIFCVFSCVTLFSYWCSRVFSIQYVSHSRAYLQTVLTWDSKFPLLICDVSIYVLAQTPCSRMFWSWDMDWSLKISR